MTAKHKGCHQGESGMAFAASHKHNKPTWHFVQPLKTRTGLCQIVFFFCGTVAAQNGIAVRKAPKLANHILVLAGVIQRA